MAASLSFMVIIIDKMRRGESITGVDLIQWFISTILSFIYGQVLSAIAEEVLGGIAAYLVDVAQAVFISESVSYLFHLAMTV